MSKKKTKKFRQDRKLWFRIFKTILKIRYRKPNFIYLGDKPTSQSIILSNHIGARVPLTLELYADFPIRFWGTHEMNTGLRNMYRYQTKTYYHGKKGWNIHLARLFCLLASPLTNIFYKGLRLISTYQDYRLRATIQESLEVIQNGGNIVVFPEDSSEGYLDEMKSFYAGFALLAERALKLGIDMPIYVSYLRPKDNTYVYEKPILYSELKKQIPDKHDMAKYLLDKANSLGKVKLKELKSET
jgi:hypothetical protein